MLILQDYLRWRLDTQLAWQCWVGHTLCNGTYCYAPVSLAIAHRHWEVRDCLASQSVGLVGIVAAVLCPPDCPVE